MRYGRGSQAANACVCLVAVWLCVLYGGGGSCEDCRRFTWAQIGASSSVRAAAARLPVLPRGREGRLGSDAEWEDVGTGT